MISPIAAALIALTLAQSSEVIRPEPIPQPVVPVPPAPELDEPPIPSLLSAAPLRGTSLLSASLGWPRVRMAYAQGITTRSDVGAFVDLDYSTTELRAGATYRGQIIPRAPPFDGALRLSLAWYQGFGGRWVYRTNHEDHGVELGLGVSYSRQGRGGLLSVLADLPITVTFRKDGGVFVNPRVGAAYEAPLFGPFTVGLQLGLGVRGGVGSAPLRRGLAEVTGLVLVSYRVQ